MVSLSGVARFLVGVNASEQLARQILMEARRATLDENGQLICYTDAAQALGVYSQLFSSWTQSPASLSALCRMAQDSLSGRSCVVLEKSLAAFLDRVSMPRSVRKRILRRAGYWADGGVITTSTFEVYLPLDLLPSYLAFNGITDYEVQAEYTDGVFEMAQDTPVL